MKTVKMLSDLDFLRFRPSLPGFSRKGIALLLAYTLVPLAGSFYLFRGQETPQLLFAVGGLAVIALAVFFSMFHIMTFWTQTDKEWWLTFPFPRFTLIAAKAHTFTRLACRVALILAAVCAAHYALAVRYGIMKPLPAAELAASAAATFVAVAAALPVAVALGLMATALYIGWTRWLVVLYAVVMQTPFILTGVLFGLKETVYAFLSPGWLLLYAAGTVLIGWPAAYLILRFAANRGLERMGDSRYSVKSSLGAHSPVRAAGINISMKKGFHSLYLLERTRYRHFGSLLPVRLILYAIILGVAAGAFFAVRNSEAMMGIPMVLFILLSMGSTIWTMNLNNTEVYKKRIEWWLGFPYERSSLLLSRLAAVWVTVMQLYLALTAAFWIGAALGMAVHPVGPEELRQYVLWFVYSFLIYTAASTFSMAILQLSHLFMKSSSLSIFTVPLYFFAMFQSQLLMKYLYPKNLDKTSGLPDWSTVWAIWAIGIPLAAVCIGVGAKYLHVLLKVESSPKWARTRFR